MVCVKILLYHMYFAQTINFVRHRHQHLWFCAPQASTTMVRVCAPQASTPIGRVCAPQASTAMGWVGIYSSYLKKKEGRVRVLS